MCWLVPPSPFRIRTIAHKQPCCVIVCALAHKRKFVCSHSHSRSHTSQPAGSARGSTKKNNNIFLAPKMKFFCISSYQQLFSIEFYPIIEAAHSRRQAPTFNLRATVSQARVIQHYTAPVTETASKRERETMFIFILHTFRCTLLTRQRRIKVSERISLSIGCNGKCSALCIAR